MTWCAEANSQPYHVPKGVALGRVDIVEIDRMPTVRFLPETVCERVVIYLHGGAFLTQPTIYQMRFCAELSQAISARILMPLYPLLPRHHCTDALAQLLPFCTGILSSEALPVTMMGDSSGGGLCAAICEELDDILQPEKLVLISPWIDVRMETREIEKLESLDPVLSKPGLVMLGREWAGELEPSDSRVSPITGDLTRFNNVTLFTGDREILYPDILRFHCKLEKAGCHAELIVGEGEYHVYPLYNPTKDDRGFRKVCRAVIQADGK